MLKNTIYLEPFKQHNIGLIGTYFRIFLALLGMFLIQSLFYHAPVFAQTSQCLKGTTLNVVAHQDDDLLFLNPDILHAIHADRCVRTIYITAGDAGLGKPYWQGRESGEKAAYAQMLGAKNDWSQKDAGIKNHPIPLFTLNDNAKISLAFLRLPDGGGDGSGFGADNNQSIKKLWNGDISTINTLDGSSSYTKQQLIDTILAMMNVTQPDQIFTLNYLDTFTSSDHSDHITTGYVAYDAHKRYTKAHAITAYIGYPMTYWSASVFGSDKTAKQQAFLSYAQFDPNVCKTESACQSTDYGRWIERQYIAGTESVVPPSITPTQALSFTPTPRPSASPTPRWSRTSTPTPTPTKPKLSPTPTRSLKPSMTPTPTTNHAITLTPTLRFSIPIPKRAPLPPTF